MVWEDRVFLLVAEPIEPERQAQHQAAAKDKQANDEWPPDVRPLEQRFVVVAIERDSGDVAWKQTATQKLPHEGHYVDSSWASASPVTDGEILIAHFGSNGTFAYDLDGKLLWQTDLGEMETRNDFGEGSSPSLFGNHVVINWDHEGDSFLVALDKKSGEEVWRTDRPGEVTSWATPLIVEHDSGTQIVIPATGKSRGYDLASGKELWSLGGMTVNTIPSPVHLDGVVYLASGYGGTMLQAVDLGQAKGDVEGSKALLWDHDRHTPYVPSVLLFEDHLYFLKHFKNILTSLDARSGEIFYTEVRLDGISNVWASPVGAAGKIYVVGRAGNTAVIEYGPRFNQIATNELDDHFDATPALVDNEMYLRGLEYLYKIVEDSGAESESAAKTDSR